ncbi:DUF2797 domain-containing protein [Catalinimonas niigatensis]|uniref:DUF2797 domain-containing protein n=1 Tax=Catalinimonas niigatensis TaxID=1397264 RepID=UPI00266645F2|nr:DUF2797 domain-containing protein [Catalinimonas niigatensis]WPP52298.1 DUF2797 domain-containing protein [Catalinimonas niigatensis]
MPSVKTSKFTALTYEGNLLKMRVALEEPVRYTLRLEKDEIDMNQLLGQQIHIAFEGRINCVNCGRITKKSFGQGFCYPCFIKAPENSECILRPELCRAHLGEGRDVEWEKAHHLQPHIVYLAQTDAIKVGITRTTQVPTRWIDQGARRALPIATVPYRYLAGQIEVALKDQFTDKTNWRNMLKNVVNDELHLEEHCELAHQWIPEELGEYILQECPITEIHYPVLEYPEKVKSLILDKNPVISSTLLGIRGQYLIFDNGEVFNIRNHSGYYIHLSY